MPAHRLVAQCSLCNAAASLDRFISRRAKKRALRYKNGSKPQQAQL